MTKKGKREYRRQEFNHKQYRRLAKLIHDAVCEDTYWCNYGEPGEEHRRLRMPEDDTFSDPKRFIQHCEYSVIAENLAALVQFGKGGKVRRR